MTFATVSVLWLLLTSRHSLLLRLLTLFPPLTRPPRVPHVSFPAYICHIYYAQFRTAIGLRSVLRPYPHTQPDVISVRQTTGLPTPSFRFRLTADTLGVRLYPSRCRADSGLSPVRNVRRRAHITKRRGIILGAAALKQVYFFRYSVKPDRTS